LEIMSDSRVGNFGAITGFCVLLLKLAALSSLSYIVIIPIFLVVPAWARWAESYAIGAFPYLRETGMGKVWHDTMVYPRDLAIGAVVPLILTAAAVWYLGIVAFVATVFTIIGGIVTAQWINSILGGQTGDTYGAVVELAETAGLVSTALFISKLTWY
jgi:adenosylcobinamide-GDP ribazoletransferase